MTESAFAEEPWLVERNGRFLQVTEMLYHVAELADGRRSVYEMARALSATVGAEVSAEHVQRLLEAKLVPIGIVAADSTLHAAAPVSPARPGAARSPLALSMRMALVSPRLVDPATRVLQYLYAPPVLVLVLFVTIQAQFWLFFVHGMAASVYQAFNKPGVVPLAFALLIASAAFHEVGHAAALRYGGGRVRSMGVGLYLMYPAFYTDVTDNYRLGRWARVRTDLGGFYFNLVFSLALMGVYHLTGQEFLLLVAVLIDIDIAHQCLPFVRLDGYWALADLTGIPDFFSLMGAYLRSVVPVPGWSGRKLPRLKWWAKAVFGLYIGIALPAIAFLLFAMLNATPRVLMTAWDAAQRQLAEVAAAQATGDGAGVAGAEAELLLLLLPALGLCLMLFTLTRTLAHGLWRWGRPTPARRLAASLAAALTAVFLVLLWVPDLRPTANARGLDWAHAQGETVESTAGPAVGPTVVTPTASAQSAAPATAAPTATPAVTPTPTEAAQPVEPSAAVAAAQPSTPTEVSRGVPTPTVEEAEAPTPRTTERPTSRGSEPPPEAPRAMVQRPAPAAPAPVRAAGPAALAATPPSRPATPTAAPAASPPSRTASPPRAAITASPASSPNQPGPGRARLTASPTRP